jgi:hypothetical protein
MAIQINQIVKNLIPTEPVTINQIQQLGSMVSLKFTGINSNKVNSKVISIDDFEKLEVLTEDGNFNFREIRVNSYFLQKLKESTQLTSLTLFLL